MLGRITKPGRVFSAVLAATLAVFGALVATLTLNLRGQLRDGVLRREAEAIHAVAQMHLASAAQPLADAGADGAMADLFAAVLESSRLHGVLAVQLFDPDGRLRDALPPAGEALAGAPWWPARLEEPVARFLPQGALESVFGLPPAREATRVPLLEVVVPLRTGDRRTPVRGTARYWIDGAAVSAEFTRMNRALFRQTGAAFAGGAAVVTLVLAWAFSRLAKVNRQLAAQSADLARANQELAFAAKTGAIGAISAHLIHGLNNPLSGLEGFVLENAGTAATPAGGEAWRTAVDTTRRLRELINEVVTVLRDEAEGPSAYRVPVSETISAVLRRNAAAAEAAGVALTVATPGHAELSARTANLTGLVLANLVANAIEASPRGASVDVTASIEAGAMEFCVRDSGPGLAEAQRERLFQPVRSAKPGGGGIGLAISRQIARHAGGELELAQSGAGGSVFRLRVPL